MRRQIIILTAVILTVAGGVPAADLRRPPCDFACQMGWTDPAFRRVVPLDPWEYYVPRSVGVNLQAIDLSEGPIPWWAAQADQGKPNWVNAAWVRDEFGITAISFMLAAHPYENIYENIRKLFRLDGLEIVVIRPEHWGVVDQRCDGSDGVLWTNYPAGANEFHQWGYSLFDKMYEYYANQGRAIFITNIEADWQMHGVGCRARDRCVEDQFYQFVYDFCVDDMWQFTLEYDEPPTCQQVACDETKLNRGRDLLREFNYRQAAAERARAANPDAALRVWNVIEVNMYATEPWQFIDVVCGVIPQMPIPPDFISMSGLYGPERDPVADLHYVMDCTGLPANRIFISEVGARVGHGQYDRIYNYVTALFKEGIAFALVWDLDVWPNDTEWSVVDPVSGEWRGGMVAIQELNDEWR